MKTSDLSEPEDHVDNVISKLKNLDKDYVELDIPNGITKNITWKYGLRRMRY